MNVNGIGQNPYQNNVPTNKSSRSGAGQFYPQKQAAEATASEGTRQNANVQDIYASLKTTNPLMGQEDSAAAKDSGLTVWYGDKTLEEWAATDPCKETGESWLKKFAEMTGTIQHLDDNTTAYVGTNGTVIKSKDGKELEIDTSSMTYDMIMNMLRNLPKSGKFPVGRQA